MSWIKIQNGVVTNKKTARLAGQMKWKKLEAVGFLVSFWIWALENCEDGLLKDISDNEIAFAVGLENADGILHALQIAGLVDKNPLRIHDWPEYQHEFLRTKYRREPEKHQEIIQLYRYSTGTTPDREREREIDIERERENTAPANPVYRYNTGTAPVQHRYSTGTAPVQHRIDREIDRERERTTAAPAEPGADGGGLVNWENCHTPQQKLGAHYLKIYSPDIYRKASPVAVKAFFSRFGRALSDICNQCAGEVPVILAAFDLCADNFRKNNLAWTLDTAAKHISDFYSPALKICESQKKEN